MCGVRITQNMDFSFKLDQTTFVHEKLQTIDIPKGVDRPATEREISQLRGLNGGLQWKATQTGPQICASLNAIQSQVTKATLKTIREANELTKYVKSQDYSIKIHSHKFSHWQELAVFTWADAAQGDRPDGGSTGGYVTCLGEAAAASNGCWTDMSLVAWGTGKLPRVARSSLSAEVQQACIAEEETFLVRLMWAEINGVDSMTADDIVNAVPAFQTTDAKALFDAVKSETSALGLKERRSGIELLALKENLKTNQTNLRWVNSGAMLADAMTKSKARHIMEMFLREPSWKLVQDEKFESYKKRKAKGGDAFDKVEHYNLSDSDPETETENTQNNDGKPI